MSNFNTKKVHDMPFFLSGDYYLKFLIEIENIDTSKITDILFMFHYNKYMSYANLSHFDTRNALKMADIISQ